jgi:hypothetical protein
MTSQMIYLNASITQSKLPIMIQTQIQAININMRWGGINLTWRNHRLPSPTRINSSLHNSICGWVKAKRGIWSKRVLWEQTVISRSAYVEGILWLFTNFYLQRKFSIFLRNDHDCKVVDPYYHFPQDWPHGGIQRIGWPANRSRFLTKWLKRGHVHNLDLLKIELSNKNPAKKAQTHKKSNFGKHPT